MKTNKLLYFDKYGILRFDLGGKILLLFLTEITAIWVAFIILANWDYFNDTDYGLAILSSDVIFLSVTLSSIFFKNKYLKIYHTEIIKQLCNLLFFAIVFLIIYFYKPRDIDDRRRGKQNLYFYTNPVTMTYIFILVYMVCFYIIFNDSK